MNFYNKHYIVVNDNQLIIQGFSDAFETPEPTDICINEKGGRHFELLGETNPALIDMQNCHRYKYVDGVVVLRSESELLNELAGFPKEETIPTIEEYVIDLDYRLSKIEMGV